MANEAKTYRFQMHRTPLDRTEYPSLHSSSSESSSERAIGLATPASKLTMYSLSGIESRRKGSTHHERRRLRSVMDDACPKGVGLRSSRTTRTVAADDILSGVE